MPGSVLITVTCLALLSVTLAGVCLVRAFDALRKVKRWSELQREVSDLQGDFASLMESHKRLRSRIAMQTLRAGKEPPPAPERMTKAQLREKYFGAAAGPAFARKQIALVDADTHDNE